MVDAALSAPLSAPLLRAAVNKHLRLSPRPPICSKVQGANSFAMLLVSVRWYIAFETILAHEASIFYIIILFQ